MDDFIASVGAAKCTCSGGYTGPGPHPGDAGYVAPPPRPVYTSDDFISFELAQDGDAPCDFYLYGLTPEGYFINVWGDSESREKAIDATKAFANGKPIIIKEEITQTSRVQ